MPNPSVDDRTGDANADPIDEANSFVADRLDARTFQLAVHLCDRQFPRAKFEVVQGGSRQHTLRVNIFARLPNIRDDKRLFIPLGLCRCQPSLPLYDRLIEQLAHARIVRCHKRILRNYPLGSNRYIGEDQRAIGTPFVG